MFTLTIKFITHLLMSFSKRLENNIKKKRLVVKIKKRRCLIMQMLNEDNNWRGGGGCEVFGKNVQYIDIGVCEYRPS